MFSWQGPIWRRVPPHTTPITATWLHISSYSCKSLLAHWCLGIVIFESTSRIGIFNIPCEIAHRPVLKSLWWWVNIGLGNGLVPPGSKPLSEPMLDQIYMVIWCHFRPWWVKSMESRQFQRTKAESRLNIQSGVLLQYLVKFRNHKLVYFIVVPVRNFTGHHWSSVPEAPVNWF